MRQEKALRVEELQEIRVGGGGAQIERWELRALEDAWAMATSRRLGSFFRFGARSVAAANWIGVLRGEGVALEVVPRGAISLAAGELDILDRNIDRMITLELGEPVRSVQGGMSGRGDRIEGVISAFCSALTQARRKHILRGYSAQRGRTRSLRGALVFPEQALTAVIQPAFFETRWVELSEDVALNRFLKGVLNLARSRVSGEGASRIDRQLGEMELVSLTDNVWREYELIDLSRLSAEYGQAVELGRSILRGEVGGILAGGTTGGSEVIFAPELFEGLVGHLSSTAANRQGLKLSWGRGGIGYPLADRVMEDGGWRSAIRAKPDGILVDESAGVVKCVIDAKWKSLDPNGPSFGVEAGDVHQMIAYCQVLRCDRAILFYPWIGADSPFGGGGVGSMVVRGAIGRLEVLVACVPLLQEGLEGMLEEIDWILSREGA